MPGAMQTNRSRGAQEYQVSIFRTKQSVRQLVLMAAAYGSVGCALESGEEASSTESQAAIPASLSIESNLVDLGDARLEARFAPELAASAAGLARSLVVALAADGPCADGSCALRVDPEAGEGGDGSSWDSPLSSIQEAIDTLSAQGGGEVWVRGGATPVLEADPMEPLIALAPAVHVFGGFSGSESTRDEREPDARTAIQGAPEAGAPLMVGASDSSLDGFAVVDHDGTSLRLEGAEGFHVSNLTIEGGFLYESTQIEVYDSSGILEGLELRDGLSVVASSGLTIESSEVELRGSTFERLRTGAGDAAGVYAGGSSLIVDGVWFVENDSGDGPFPGLGLEDSTALITSSVWLGNAPASPLRMNHSDVVVVESHFEGNIADGPAAEVRDSTALFLNSSFVENVLQTGAIYATTGVEVVNTTFFDNEPAADFPADVDGSLGAELVVHNSFSNRAEADSVKSPYTGGGNCFVSDGEVVSRDGAGYREVLLTPDLGCTDQGDDAAANGAILRAQQFAEGLGTTLSASEGWWASSSSTATLCTDDGAIDPGRHVTDVCE